MLKINIYLKFALIAVFLIGGILLSFLYGFGYSWILLLIGILLLISYIMLGTIQSASEFAQNMDFDNAEKRLDLTLSPKWLYVTNRAFYYILKGSIAANRKETKIAENYFNDALALNLPSDNEKAMVLLQLSNINGTRGNWQAAKNYFREAKKLNITEKQIKEQLAMFEKAIGNSGQMKNSSAMAGQRGGGRMMQGGKSKRRRPRMR